MSTYAEVGALSELVALIQREREQHLENARRARLVACERACCNPTLVDRLASALRGTHATC